MWWIISAVAWFLIGIISTVVGIHIAMTERGGMTLSDCLIGSIWLFIGPIMWCAVLLQTLTKWINENSTKMIFKAKK